MKKYLEIAKAYMKAQLIWRSDTLVDVILAVAKILFAWILWSILFEGKEQIAGLGFQAMISYYIISSYLFQLEKSAEISADDRYAEKWYLFKIYGDTGTDTGVFCGDGSREDCVFCGHWFFSNVSVVLFVPDSICAYSQYKDPVMRKYHGCFRTVVYGAAQLLSWDFDLEI